MYSEDGMTKTGKKWKWLELNMPMDKKKKTCFFVNGIGKKKSCFLLVEIGALKESISPLTNYLITTERISNKKEYQTSICSLLKEQHIM